MMSGFQPNEQFSHFHPAQRELALANGRSELMRKDVHSMEQVRITGNAQRGQYDDLSNPNLDDGSMSKMKGQSHKMKKKLPITKRTSASAGTTSYDSDIYSNSRLEVASTVSSSDLESSHSNVTETLIQPAQHHLQSVRTGAGIHAPATSSQVRLDERASQGWPDKSHSGSLHETHAQQHTTSVAQGHMFQPPDDASSPRKLAIRRCPQASRGSQHGDHRQTQPSYQSLFPSQQQPAPSPIMEEPYSADVGSSLPRPQQQATNGTPNSYNIHTGYRHSIATPSTKLPAGPGGKYIPDYLNRFEFGSEGPRPESQWDQFHFGTHAPTSPGSGTGSTSPKKLAIRRSNQPSGHVNAGVHIQHSPDQSGFLSPRYMHAKHSVPHSPPRTDPAAIFAQRDAEYMHAYQAQYMWQQQQQQRRASMGSTMLYHTTADSRSTAASSGRKLRWDTLAPQKDMGGRAKRNPGTPDKRRLPTAAELNLPGWY